MNPTTLYDYYTSKGQALPSVQQRSSIFESYGLGAANTYQGTSSQNTILLQRLLGGAPAPPATARQPYQQPQSQPQAQPQNYQPQSQSGGSIPLNQLPADLLYNGQLDVSNPVKQAKYDQLNQQWKQQNQSSNPSMPGQPPTFDLIGVTNSAYNSPEIIAANQAVSQANAEITARQQALAEAQAKINDNPFYSEATRVGKSQQLTQQANNDMLVIQNKATQAQNQLAGLKADAAIKVNAASGQYNINRQAYQDTLNQFNNLLKAGAFTNVSPEELANISVQTGIPYSQLQSIQKQQQHENIKTQLVTSDNGTVSIINSETGELIAKTNPGVGTTKNTVGGSVTERTAASAKQAITDMSSLINGALDQSGKKNSALQKGGDGYLSPDAYRYYRDLWISQGLSTKDFEDQFSYLKNPYQSGY